MATKSELLFDQYCRARDYGCEPIEVELGRRTPDRLVTTPLGSLIAEIKEISPNEKDVREIRELNRLGHTDGINQPGARVYEKIRSAATQLRNFADRAVPLMLVLFDNVVVDGTPSPAHYLESAFVDFGMYGLQNVILAKDTSAGQDRWLDIGDARGGERQLTPTSRTYISGVAVLEARPDPCLFVYHNYFATLPLNSDIFRGSGDRHFRKPTNPDESLQQWVEIHGDAA